MAGLVIAGVLLLAVIVTISLGVRLVPQGYEYVMQRLGKYQKTLKPGLNVVIPYIDSVAAKVPTKDLTLDVPSQDVITKDNAVVTVNAVAFIKVHTPHKAVYGIDNYSLATRQLVMTNIRAIIGEMALDDALSSRDQIKAKLIMGIKDDVVDWGLTVKNVEIQDINPSATLQNAMEQQAAAERQRRADISIAGGQKAAAILKAEGELEASRKKAEAVEVLAEASRNAIEKVAAGIKGEELPAMYLLGEKYIETLRGLGDSPNSKLVVYPADLPSAVKGLLSQKS